MRHSMECEDSAQAMLELANGSPGYFATNTIEAGQTGRIPDHRGPCLAGDRTEAADFDTLRAQFGFEYMMTSPEMWGSPQAETEINRVRGDRRWAPGRVP